MVRSQGKKCGEKRPRCETLFDSKGKRLRGCEAFPNFERITAAILIGQIEMDDAVDATSLSWHSQPQIGLAPIKRKQSRGDKIRGGYPQIFVIFHFTLYEGQITSFQ